MSARGALAVLLALAPAAAQGLPTDFQAGFDAGGSFACALDLGAGPDERVRVRVAFRNRPGALAVTAEVGAVTGAGAALERLTWDTDYAPTSVCAAGERSPTIYVTGWSAPRGEVVVEEWTLGAIAVVPAGTPDGRDRLQVEPPARRPLPLGAALPIVRCAAFHPQAGLLFLLCDGEPVTIRVLDVRSGRLAEQPLASSAQHPVLAGQRSLNAGRDREAGFLLYTESRPRWGDPRFCPPPCRVLEWRDADLDGRFEQALELDWDDFIEAHASRWIPVETPPAATPAPAAGDTGAPR